jgi:serine/threonine-protein kinase
MAVEGDDDTIASSLPAVTGTAELVDNTLVAKRYRIVRWLGGGGMGRVYEAYDTELGEKVALKVLRDGLVGDALERFRREVKLTRRILHRNVARMHDIGDHGGDKFLTMELVEGSSLARELGTPMPWARLRAVATQICDGLAAAHAAGVVHRDLKPDNVLVERGTDRVVITDFGIARGGGDPQVTQVGAVVGTPRYMAPEQLAGDDVDARADLFALGIILFELAMGTRPWPGDNAVAIAIAQATQPARELDPSRSAAPDAFASIVSACLEINRASRPASAADVAAALADGTPIAGIPKPPTGETRALRPERAAPAQPALPSVPAIVHAPTSLAVLPPTCAPGDEYLADGLLEDLVDTLSTTAGLRVRPAGVARASSTLDARALGRELAVDHVVSASIRRAPAPPAEAIDRSGAPSARPAGKLRVAARMTSVVDGFQIWAHRLDCTEAEILATSGELARGIADALSTRATGTTRPTDPRAVDLYLRARAEMRRFWGPHMLAATDLLEKAVEHAPTSTPILGAFAYASVQSWVMRGTAELRARAEANLARGLASGAGEAFLASAQFAFNRDDYQRGAHDLATALVRAPMLGQAHELAGRILVEVDTPATARHHFDTACALEPNRAQLIAVDLARIDALEGNWPSAERRVAGLADDPDPAIAQFGFITTNRLLNGWRNNRETIEAIAERIPRRMGETPMHTIEFVRVLKTSADVDSTAWRDYLAPRGPDSPLRPHLISLQILGELALVFGRKDLALDAIGHAADIGLMDITWLDHCPLFLEVRSRPELAKIRLKVQARASRVLAAFRSVATAG